MSDKNGFPWTRVLASALIMAVVGGLVIATVHLASELATARALVREATTTVEHAKGTASALHEENVALRRELAGTRKEAGEVRREALDLAEAVEKALAADPDLSLAAVIEPGMNYCDWAGRYGSDASHRMIRRLADAGVRKLVPN